MHDAAKCTTHNDSRTAVHLTGGAINEVYQQVFQEAHQNEQHLAKGDL